ncbi:MAG: radical SAM protein [Candidatus Nitrosotenuis sp.]
MVDGYKIVLTGSKTAVSDFRHFSYIGFLGCIPSNYPKIPFNVQFMESLFFPTQSDQRGRLKYAPYSLRKIEASLLEHGFKEDEVIVADPRKLHRVIGPNTKAIGITVHDPMGYSAVSQLNASLFRLINWWPAPSYTAIDFKNFIANPLLKKYGSRLIVGGPGVWQLEEHPEMFSRWGIDCIVTGEAEGLAGKLFEDAINGQLPQRITSTKPLRVDQVPLIRNPSTGGIVEITRGCGRGCQFCSPDLLAFGSIPKEKILKEVELEVKSGIERILLHSEDALFYGRKMGSFEVNHDAIVDLFSAVKKTRGVKGVETDFFACSTIKSSPRTLKAMSEIMELDKNHPGYVETGLETVSPTLVRNIMPGKVKPYKIEEWPDVIDDALGILDDNHWFTVASMMTGLPKETEDDVLKSIEFIDRIKHHNVFVWVFPLMPLRAMRKNAAKWMPQYTPLRQELILKATQHSVDLINKEASRVLKILPAWVRFPAKATLKYVTKMTLMYFNGTQRAIEHGQDRLQLYKDFESGFSDGQEVMQVSNVVSNLVKIGNKTKD